MSSLTKEAVTLRHYHARVIQEFLSTQKRSDRFLGLPSAPSNGYRELRFGG